MKRILWLSAEVPDLGMGGGNIRQARLLDAVSSRHEVHLGLVGALRDDSLHSKLASVREFAVPVPHAVRGKTSQRLYDVRHMVAHRLPAEGVEQRRARRLLTPLVERERDFDVVCVEQIGLTPLLRPERAAHWMATLHYLPSLQARQFSALGGWRQRRFWSNEAAKASRLERWTARHYDRVIVCSDADAATLDGRTSVVPNGTDILADAVRAVPRNKSLVVVATLGYLPNVDGVRWLATEVMPLVLQSVPSATLTIVGRNAVDEIRALGQLPGITLCLDVEATVPFLQAARVALVPIRVGAGTRLKALEAMAVGRPIVGTTIGLAGLDVVEGVHVRIADTTGSFAAAIVELLNDDEASDRLAREGRALVERRYSWDRIGEGYADLIDGLP